MQRRINWATASGLGDELLHLQVYSEETVLEIKFRKEKRIMVFLAGDENNIHAK